MTSESDFSEDRLVLAAEYVLGTLDAAERADAEHLIATEPEFARLVADWERRLGELHAMVDPVEPPEAVWQRIRDAIPGLARAGLALPPVPGPVAAAEPSPAAAAHPDMPEAPIVVAPAPTDRLAPTANDNVVRLGQALGRWRAIGAAMTGVAAVLAAVIATGVVAPDRLPAALRPKPQVVEVTRDVVREAARPAGRYVAVLQRDPKEAAFVLSVDMDTKSFSVRRITDAPEQGKSYELWLISQQFSAPRSLGVVDTTLSRPAALANYDPATIDAATYAITLEPQGGSPTGVATGPVLWTGTLVDMDQR